jgi:hypothetical protein
MLTLKKKYQVSQRTHCTCIKLNLIDNFNISTLNKNNYEKISDTYDLMDPQERLVGFSVLLSPSDYASF